MAGALVALCTSAVTVPAGGGGGVSPAGPGAGGCGAFGVCRLDSDLSAMRRLAWSDVSISENKAIMASATFSPRLIASSIVIITLNSSSLFFSAITSPAYDGGEIVQPKDEGLHPRTAVGVDESGRRLHLVVVDGRQPGYSEGMTRYELAVLMQELDCWDAGNLDGGGSSVMILRGEGDRLHVVNDPSPQVYGISVLRPIPVGLAVRKKPRARAGGVR